MQMPNPAFNPSALYATCRHHWHRTVHTQPVLDNHAEV